MKYFKRHRETSEDIKNIKTKNCRTRDKTAKDCNKQQHNSADTNKNSNDIQRQQHTTTTTQTKLPQNVSGIVRQQQNTQQKHPNEQQILYKKCMGTLQKTSKDFKKTSTKLIANSLQK